MADDTLDDVLVLAALLRPAWARVSDAIPAWHPRCEGDEEGEGDDGENDDGAGDDSDDGEDDEDRADSDQPKGDKPTGSSLDEWKRQSRKHERDAKKARAERDELATKLREREDADKSEQERAVEAAARKAREEALSEAQKERRADKLEMAVTKVAAVRGVKVTSGDSERVVKFSDPDDVQMWLDRQIERGDIDADAIFRDGRVAEDALAEELARLAVAKPSWLVGASKGKPAGDSDGGKGTAPAVNSVEAELAKIQRRRDPTRT